MTLNEPLMRLPNGNMRAFLLPTAEQPGAYEVGTNDELLITGNNSIELAHFRTDVAIIYAVDTKGFKNFEANALHIKLTVDIHELQALIESHGIRKVRLSKNLSGGISSTLQNLLAVEIIEFDDQDKFGLIKMLSKHWMIITLPLLFFSIDTFFLGVLTYIFTFFTFLWVGKLFQKLKKLMVALILVCILLILTVVMNFLTGTNFAVNEWNYGAISLILEVIWFGVYYAMV